MKPIHFLLLLLVFGFTAFPQKVLQYNFNHYTTQSGLISNQPNAVYQDEEGYLWIGSTGGLQRYDGSRFRTFRNFSGDSSSQLASSVFLITPIDNNRLCLMMENGSTGIFNTKTLRYSKIDINVKNEQSLDAPLKRLIRNEQGNIFLLMPGAELLMLDSGKNEFRAVTDFMQLPDSMGILAFTQQPGTRKYWISFANKGIVVYDAATRQLHYAGQKTVNEPALDRFATIGSANSFFFDKNNRLWIDSRENDQSYIWCYDFTKQKFILERSRPPSVFDMNRKIRSFMQQTDGTVWIYGEQVLAKYNEAQNLFEAVYDGYVNESGISYRVIVHMLEDREKNIWTSTGNNGIFRFNPAEEFFTAIKYSDRFNGHEGDSNPIAFAEDKDQSVLVGYWGTGLYRFDKNMKQVPLNIKGIPDSSQLAVWDMCYSSDTATIWMSAWKGFYKYNTATKSAVYYNPAVMKNEVVREIREDKLGNLWFGLNSFVVKWDAKKGNKNFDDGFYAVTTIPARRVNQLLIDKDGFVWVGTAGKGIYVLNPATDEVVMHFGIDESGEKKLPEKTANRLFEYNDSLIIIGTMTRVLVYNRKAHTTKLLDDSRTTAGKIAAIEKDKSGNIWIDTTSGLYKTDINGKLFVRFDRDDGIASDFFVFSSSCLLRNGRMLFGGTGSIITFQPEDIKTSKTLPELKITGIRVMNEQLVTDSVLRLTALKLGMMENSLVVEFSPLTYGSSFNVQYKLTGLDNDWIKADGNNQAIYSHLSPGSYTLIFRLVNEDGDLLKSSTVLSIVVTPPFWRTWWFYCVLGLAFIGMLFWFDRERQQRKEAMYAMRTRIAMNMHEQLSSALGSINVLSEMARIKADKEPEKSKDFIEQIRNKSGSMIHAMEDMLWSISPENDSMQKALSRMQEYIEGLNSQYQSDIYLEVDEQVNDMNLDMQFRHESMLLFKDLLLGLAKANAGRCNIRLRPDRNNLIFSVQYQHELCKMQQLTNLLHSHDMTRRLADIKASVVSDINKSSSVLLLKVPVS